MHPHKGKKEKGNSQRKARKRTSTINSARDWEWTGIKHYLSAWPPTCKKKPKTEKNGATGERGLERKRADR